MEVSSRKTVDAGVSQAAALPPQPPDVSDLEFLPGRFLLPRNASDEETLGDWLEENDSATEFDKAVDGTYCFTTYREVSGRYMQPKIVNDDDPKSLTLGCRIDRVLVPTKKLIEAGWPQWPDWRGDRGQ